MDAHPIFLPASGYRRERWHNGAGWTREIARGGSGEGEWDWRMSIAEIDASAEFSRLPGIEREQVLLSGDGLALEFTQRRLVLEPPHGRHRYPGEAEVRGVPLGGPVRAFNLMWRRARIEAALWHRPLVGSMVLFAEPRSSWAVHLLAGKARFADGSGLPALAAGDTAILAAGESRTRHVLDGSGEALLICIAPACRAM